MYCFKHFLFFCWNFTKFSDILVKYFKDFGQRKYEKIIEKLGCTKEALQESITAISQLNPHPGDGFEYSEKDGNVRGTNITVPFWMEMVTKVTIRYNWKWYF